MFAGFSNFGGSGTVIFIRYEILFYLKFIGHRNLHRTMDDKFLNTLSYSDPQIRKSQWIGRT
jgi:hypothetical protein